MHEQPTTANMIGSPTEVLTMMVTGGRCVTNTLQSLEEGGAAKPMARAALERTYAQACTLLEKVLEAYETDVAPGEVGANGLRRAMPSPPIAGRCPTGLLYGRIQSGKTVAMITFAALAIDNGFRIIVVLTSDNVKLVEQTAARFTALDGIVMSSTKVANWPADASHVKKNLPDVGLVLVCAKNQSHLASLVDFLESIGAADYPALVMDDEADQATLDTTVNSRAVGGPKAPKFGSTINRRTVRNDRPDQVGESVSEVLRHHVFLQVTATPYALLLQNIDSPLRPKFTALLEPGEGYTGGEAFFSGEHLDDEAPPLVFVPDEESEELDRGVVDAPEGLSSALAFFLVASGAQAVLDPSMGSRAQNFLCHTSQRRMDHERVSDLIRRYVERVGDELRKPTFGGEVAIHMERARNVLLRTVPSTPTLDSIVSNLRHRLPKRQVVVVNSDGGNAEFARGINFIVGGNILGRGLTIDNLLVTYYLRRAKVSQMDTMLQHARMFGYRRSLMPFTRVFVPERLALRFHRIHTAEEHLRHLLSDPDRRARIPVQVSDGLRATRPGVLDMRNILAYTPGQHIYPAAPLVTVDAHKLHERARKEVEALGVVFGDGKVEHEPVKVSLADLQRLVELLPYDRTDEDGWDPRAICGYLACNATRFSESGLVYARRMKRTKYRQGALGGDELTRLRGCRLPVLCAFLDEHKKFDMGHGIEYQHEYVYPSLVLPDVDGTPAHVFNVSDYESND